MSDIGVNTERAIAAWGSDMPDWVRILADACDRAGQRSVGAKLKRSSGTLSRILNRNYPGSYEEAETLVRATFAADTVACPAFGKIPLSSCVRNRRRKAAPINFMQRQFAETCPSCPLNFDIPQGGKL